MFVILVFLIGSLTNPSDALVALFLILIIQGMAELNLLLIAIHAAVMLALLGYIFTGLLIGLNWNSLDVSTSILLATPFIVSLFLVFKIVRLLEVRISLREYIKNTELSA